MQFLTHRKNLDVQNDKVKSERQAHGSHQPQVGPWWHNDKRLILRQALN